MGNTASINETINARLSQLDSIDINFNKPFSKNANKCIACQGAFNFISFKRRNCVHCMEYYCNDCVTHYKDNIYICYRCKIFISPEFGWNELMKLKSKDLIWYLNRKNISCPNCKEKEQLVEIILERFRASSASSVSMPFQSAADNVNTGHDRNSSPILSPDNNIGYFGNSSGDDANAIHGATGSSDFCQASSSSTSMVCPEPCLERIPPPSYNEAMEGCYSSSPTNRNERVLIEGISNFDEIRLLSIKQLKDMLAYNKVDYKGCVERHELISRVERLWTAYNNERNYLSSDNLDKTVQAKECIICMDRSIDCVLIECGHMLCCVRCGSKLAECPICRQNVVRCLRVFVAQ